MRSGVGKRPRRLLLLIPCLAAACAFLLAGLRICAAGYVKRQDIARGVDVSEYQGEIDWRRLVEQGICFAYVKATEGSAYRDPFFEENLKNATEAGLRVGAYHFFSFDSPVEAQAENLFAALPAEGTALPVAIDLELYGKHGHSPPGRERVIADIAWLSEAIEERYGVRPALYVTWRSYFRYARGSGLENPLWIRDVYLYPFWCAEGWFMWQYDDDAALDGYQGPEAHIDLDCMPAAALERY